MESNCHFMANLRTDDHESNGISSTLPRRLVQRDESMMRNQDNSVAYLGYRHDKTFSNSKDVVPSRTMGFASEAPSSECNENMSANTGDSFFKKYL